MKWFPIKVNINFPKFELIRDSFLKLEIAQRFVLFHYMLILTALTIFFWLTPAVHNFFIYFVAIVSACVLLLIKIITPSDVNKAIENIKDKKEGD